MWKWLQMLSSASFKHFFYYFFFSGTSMSLLLMFSHVSQWWLAFKPLVLPEKYIFQMRKKFSVKSSQLHLIILKNFLSQFLLRFVKKNGPFQDKWAVCVQGLSAEAIKKKCLNNESFVECWFQNPCEKRPHPFLVMKQLIKVYNVGLCNNIYSIEW